MSATFRRHIKLLQGYGDAYATMEREIVNKTTRQLKTLVKATKAPDESNCGWQIYTVAPIVRKIAEGELFRRSNIKGYEAKRKRLENDKPQATT